MALDKQEVPLNLGQSLDQASESFVQDQNTLEAQENLITDKQKRLSKRYGTQSIGTDVITDFPNPLTIGDSPIPSGVFSHNEQLMMQNKGALYTYSEDLEKWRFVGHHYPVEAKADTVVANESYLFDQNMGKTGNIVVYAYSCFETAGVASLRYTVIDETDEARIVFDKVIPTSTSPKSPKILAFQNTIFIMWIDGTDIKITEVNQTDGSLGPITVLKNDAASFVTTSHLDWAYTNQAGVGERAIVSYYIGPTVNLFAVTSAGVYDAAMGTFPVQDGTIAMSMFYSQNLQRLVVFEINESIFAGNVAYGYMFTFVTFTSSGFVKTSEFGGSYGGATAPSARFGTFSDDPFDSTQVLFYLNGNEPKNYNSLTYYGPIITEYKCTTAAVITQRVIAKGLVISGKAIIDRDLRQTVYIPTEYASPDWGTSFLIDVFKGKVEPGADQAAYCQTKVLPGEVYSYSFTKPILIPFPSQVPDVVSLGDGKYAMPLLRKGAVGFTQAGYFQTIENFTTCVARVDISLIPERAASREFVNNGTHLSGGYLGYYDGARYSEHGFMIPPDLNEVFAAPTNKRVLLNVVTLGDASNPAIYDISFYGGSAMLPGPTNWWGFWAEGDRGIYYIIDGVGTAPVVAGRTFYGVNISASDTAAEVAYKTYLRIKNVVPFQQRWIFTFPTNQTMRVTLIPPYFNTGPNPPTDANYANAQTGPAAGTYSYTHIWNFIDANGNMFRSSPAPIIPITKTGNFPIFYNFSAPPVTNRQCSLVGVEIYRTVNNGTTLHRITSFPLGLKLNPSRMSLSYMDIFTDAEIQDEEILYTTGGILPNFSIGACKNVSLFKNRLIVSGMDESTVYYSKKGLPLSAIDFSEVLFIAMDEDGQQITGHKQLDDKLICLKEKKVVAYAGDGANELGTDSTFSQPIDVASDTGCLAQNTIEVTPMGLYFRSRMGIQLLDRSLTMIYAGEAVKGFNAFNIERAQVLRDDDKVREVRFILRGTDRAIVYNYLSDKWGTFTNYAGTDGCLWKGSFTRVLNGIVRVENKSLWIDEGSTEETYTQVLETAWLKIKGVQDYQRIYRLAVLGALKSPHILNYKIYYDYDLTNFDEYNFNSDNIQGVQPDDTVYQPEIHLARQKGQSIKIRLEVIPQEDNLGTQEGLVLVDMSFTVGVKKGLNKVKAAKKL